MTPFLLVLLASVAGGDADDFDTVAVCPSDFRPAIQPWLDYRRAQGHAIEVLDAGLPAEMVRQRIRKLHKRGGLRHVVLLGDAEPLMRLDQAVRRRCVPVYWAKAEVNVRFGSEAHIGTDNWYADMDDDGRPELAVGRLPADTPEELASMLAKTIRYERSTDMGPWRRRIDVVAGLGGFGAVIDTVIESTTRQFVTQGLPADYAVSMTQADLNSPYCPDPRRFDLTSRRQLERGSLFWVYVGHGYHLALDEVCVGETFYPIMTTDDAAKLRGRADRTIAVFLACYTGAFDASDDCLAEELLRSPEGPVAVLAGSRVTMPYGMAVLADELSQVVFTQHPSTLGEALLTTKRNMTGQRKGSHAKMLDTMASLIGPRPAQLTEQRAEHVRLFNLLGDPLLRLRAPERIAMELPRTVAPGTSLPVSASCSIQGEATIELVLRRDRLPAGLSLDRDLPLAESTFATMDATHARANDRLLASLHIPTQAGHLTATLPIPADASGACCVRIHVAGTNGFALGAHELIVEHPTKSTLARRPNTNPQR